MTAPEARPSGLDSNARGIIVLLVAVVVGVLLLGSWGSGGSKGEEVATGGNSPVTTADLGATTTAATEDTTTSTAATEGAHSPSEVSVIVLNGSGQTGAAGDNSATVGEAGFTMLEPGNGPSTPTTTVYYAPDYEADAIAVAGLLGKGTDAVKPLSEASLAGAEGDADVVVLLGQDIPPVSSTTTTTL